MEILGSLLEGIKRLSRNRFQPFRLIRALYGTPIPHFLEISQEMSCDISRKSVPGLLCSLEKKVGSPRAPQTYFPTKTCQSSSRSAKTSIQSIYRARA